MATSYPVPQSWALDLSWLLFIIYHYYGNHMVMVFAEERAMSSLLGMFSPASSRH